MGNLTVNEETKQNFLDTLSWTFETSIPHFSFGVNIHLRISVMQTKVH